MTAETIAAAKAALRAEAKARRAALGLDAEAPARRLAPLISSHAGRVLAGYWPMRCEADPRLAMLAHDGPLCLPVVTGKGRPLAFYGWAPGQPLAAGSYGAMVPVGGGECTPRVLIVPLLAFDSAGYRLGYGGGFYDRTLERLRAAGPCLAIGLAHAAQRVPEVPRTSTDQPLDLIVTEAEIVDPQGRGLAPAADAP